MSRVIDESDLAYYKSLYKNQLDDILVERSIGRESVITSFEDRFGTRPEDTLTEESRILLRIPPVGLSKEEKEHVKEINKEMDHMVEEKTTLEGNTEEPDFFLFRIGEVPFVFRVPYEDGIINRELGLVTLPVMDVYYPLDDKESKVFLDKAKNLQGYKFEKLHYPHLEETIREINRLKYILA